MPPERGPALQLARSKVVGVFGVFDCQAPSVGARLEREAVGPSRRQMRAVPAHHSQLVAFAHRVVALAHQLHHVAAKLFDGVIKILDDGIQSFDDRREFFLIDLDVGGGHRLSPECSAATGVGLHGFAVSFQPPGARSSTQFIAGLGALTGKRFAGPTVAT